MVTYSFEYDFDVEVLVVVYEVIFDGELFYSTKSAKAAECVLNYLLLAKPTAFAFILGSAF